MMLYITKDENGLVQLWNNKPIYNKDTGVFYAWKKGKENIDNEIAIDATNNEFLNSLFSFLKTPACLRIEYIDCTLVTL